MLDALYMRSSMGDRKKGHWLVASYLEWDSESFWSLVVQETTGVIEGA